MEKKRKKTNAQHKLGKAVYSAKGGLQKLQDILEYQPTYFSQKINFKDTNVKELSTNPKELVHLYLGKIAKAKGVRIQSIYNDDFILGVLKEILERTTAKNKIEIHMGPDMSKYFNGEENIEGYMNIDEQIAYIQALIEQDKSVRKSANRIIYKNLCDIDAPGEHSVLFNALETKEVSELFPLTPQEDKPEISIENINSLKLSQYLWRVFNHNPKFKKQIKNIVPSRLKKGDNSVYLYPIVEISIRLIDFLYGKNIQGGANKQYDYDRIINLILFDDKLKQNFPELQYLQDKIKGLEHNDKFHTFYFNTKGFAEHQKQRSKLTKLQSKLRNTTLALFGLLTAFGVGRYMNIQNLKQQKQEEIKEILQNSLHNKESSVNMINQKTDMVYQLFGELYGKQAHHDEELKALIKSVILAYENDKDLRYEVDFFSSTVRIDDPMYKPKLFIEQAIVSKYGILLKERGYELMKNKHLWKYEENMLQTLQHLGKGETIRLHKNIGDRVLMGGYNELKDIGSISDNNYTTYTLALRSDNYILASDNFYNGEGEFSLQTAKKAILLYIKQTYPSIEYMTNKIVFSDRFQKGEAVYQHSEDVYSDIKLQLFVYFVQNGYIESLRERRPYGEYNRPQTIKYMDEFAKTHKTLLGKYHIFGVPGEYLLKEKQAIHNSIQEIKNKKSSYRDQIWEIDKLPKNKEYLGSYLLSTGEEYNLYKVRHNHKEYVIPFIFKKNIGGLKYFSFFYKDWRHTRRKYNN